MATNSKQLVIDFGFDSKGTSNVAGTLNVQGDIITTGSFTFGSYSGNLIPDTTGRYLGNSSLRWITNSTTIDATGALTVSNTISVGNTTITGFANVSSVLSAGNTTITGFANVSNVLAAGNTTITGFANVSNSVNSALFTVGSSLVANTTGVYHTGTINAASFTTTGLVANTTALVPTSNTILLGNSIGRFALSATSGNFSSTIDVTGSATISNTLAVGNTTINGFANVVTSVNSALFTIGSSLVANTIGIHHAGYVNAASFVTTGSGIVANTTALAPTSNTILLGNSIGRFVVSANTGNFSGTVDVTGATTISNILSAGNTTVTGFINVSSTANIGGNVNLRGTATVNGSTTIANTLAVGNTTITGFANVTSTIQGGSSLTIAGPASGITTLATGNTTITGFANVSNVLAAGNTTITGFVNTTSTIQGGSSLTIAGSASGITTLAAGNTTITGFANVTSTIQGGSSLTIAGPASGITTLAAGNTTITGFVNTTSTIQGGSSLTIAGPASGITTLAAGNTTITGFANVSNVLAAGNTTITGFANVTTSVNSALFTVGSSLVANTTGVYHTGTINAASFTTTGLVANTTALVPTSNNVLLGNSIGRFALSATSGNFSGDVTVSGNTTILGVAHAVSGNVAFDTQVLFVDSVNNRVGINTTTPGVAIDIIGSANVTSSVNSALLTVGSSFIANTLGAYHTGTVNAASFTTTGLVANTTALVPTSNTVLLGNSIGRFVLSANSGNFSGDVTAASFTTAGFVATAASIIPTSNTVLLGNNTNRFVLSAVSGEVSGTVNAISFTTTGFVANSAGLYHSGTVEAAIFNSTSDVNSKYNIKTIDDPISKVMNMRGVNFIWKHSDKPSMGLIAQEVEPIIPEVVNTDSNGKKSVSYDSIIGLLIESIKHQQKQIDSLIADKVARDGN